MENELGVSNWKRNVQQRGIVFYHILPFRYRRYSCDGREFRFET